MRPGRDVECRYTVALIGPPNVGKTTLFNVLTGASELVANWPGATVAVRYVKKRLDSLDVCIVDLPGTYSIHGTGPEEGVTREFILSNKADLMLVLADATNLERGLFLALDVLELFPRTAIVLTKMDEAARRGLEIDTEKLSGLLGAPVIAVSAVKGTGIKGLIRFVTDALLGKTRWTPRIGVVVPDELRDFHRILAARLKKEGLEERLAEWLAARLLEGVDWAEGLLEKLLPAKAPRLAAQARQLRLEARRKGIEPSTAFVAAKYEVAARLYREAVRFQKGRGEASSAELSRVDTLFLHPILGPIASLVVMLGVFLVAYVAATGSPLDLLLDKLGFKHAAELVSRYSLVNLAASVMDRIAEVAMNAIPDPVIARMIGEGVLSSNYGLGLVVSFMPLVMVLMFVIGLLEDSGLVPRIAAGVDRLFRRFGVSGKAVFPAMLSLGCNVPGVLASRVMDSDAERRALVFAVPLIPCMARFTVLMALAHVFFPGTFRSALTVFSVYTLAILVFLLTLKIVKRGLGGGEETELILELPPLKRPSLKVVWWLTWDKLKHFLVRAGTVIVAFSMVLWVAANYGPEGYLGGGRPEESYAAVLGRLLAPYTSAIFGVDNDTAWRLGFAFIGGFVAKEVFLDALAAVAPGPGGIWSYRLTPPQAMAVMIAVTLYIPCVATLSAMYSEMRSLRLVVAALIYDALLASVLALGARILLLLL